METIIKWVELATKLIEDGGWLAGFLLILVESFLPMLPLGAFVTLNVNAFGLIPGMIISWLATTLGSILTYLLFYYLSNKIIFKLSNKNMKKKITDKINHFNKIKLTNLVLIITLPFSPSCFVNMLAGITEIPKKKFIVALIIGKAFMITFWGLIGKSFINNYTNIKSLIFTCLILITAYILTKYISKKYNIE